MTKEEAVASIKTLCNTCELFPKCVNEKPECFKAIELAISALQVQGVPDTNVGDMISRQAAIETVKKHYRVDNDLLEVIAYEIEALPSAQPEQVCVANVTLTDEQVEEVVEKAKNAVISVIELEPHWIPCSERLPEIGEYVLCYLKGRRYFGQYRVCKYCAADKYVNHPYFDFNENGFPNVVAWMPLPEPYKEGGEQE